MINNLWNLENRVILFVFLFNDILFYLLWDIFVLN